DGDLKVLVVFTEVLMKTFPWMHNILSILLGRQDQGLAEFEFQLKAIFPVWNTSGNLSTFENWENPDPKKRDLIVLLTCMETPEEVEEIQNTYDLWLIPQFFVQYAIIVINNGLKLRPLYCLSHILDAENIYHMFWNNKIYLKDIYLINLMKKQGRYAAIYSLT
ncbi:hypothetical protein ACJX0J_014567, partial [Zea mays]